jgi:hypothetical protein
MQGPTAWQAWCRQQPTAGSSRSSSGCFGLLLLVSLMLLQQMHGRRHWSMQLVNRTPLVP